MLEAWTLCTVVRTVTMAVLDFLHGTSGHDIVTQCLLFVLSASLSLS